jgi:hypothetical protein
MDSDDKNQDKDSIGDIGRFLPFRRNGNKKIDGKKHNDGNGENNEAQIQASSKVIVSSAALASSCNDDTDGYDDLDTCTSSGRHHQDTAAGEAIHSRYAHYLDDLYPPASTVPQGLPAPSSSVVSQLTVFDSFSTFESPSGPKQSRHRVSNASAYNPNVTRSGPNGNERSSATNESDDNNNDNYSGVAARSLHSAETHLRGGSRSPISRPGQGNNATRKPADSGEDASKDDDEFRTPPSQIQQEATEISSDSKGNNSKGNNKGNLFDVITSNLVLLPWSSPLSRRTNSTTRSVSDLKLLSKDNGLGLDGDGDANTAYETTKLLGDTPPKTYANESMILGVNHESSLRAPVTEVTFAQQEQKQEAVDDICRVIQTIGHDLEAGEESSRLQPPPPPLHQQSFSQSIPIPHDPSDPNYYPFLYLKQTHGTLGRMPHYSYMTPLASQFHLKGEEDGTDNNQKRSKSSSSSMMQYYKFTVSKSSPFTALYKRPPSSAIDGTDTPSVISSMSAGASTYQPQQCTGLLRRSAILPAHQSNLSNDKGEWVLVNVGGRSGWARREASYNHGNGINNRRNHTSTISRAPSDLHQSQGGQGGYLHRTYTFQWKELWMGNHIFLW